VREKSVLPLQSHHVIEGVQTFGCRLDLEAIAVDTALRCSRQNQCAALPAAPTGLLSCLRFLKPIKIVATRTPREQTASK
jgi:hypothetical protein